MLKIVEETPEKFNGNAVVDFSQYRCYRATQSRFDHRKFERNVLSLVVKGYHLVCSCACKLCLQPFIPLIFNFNEFMLHRKTLKSLFVTVVF